MSDIIKSVQKQDPGSELIVLYDLEYAPGSFAYYHPGLDDSGVPDEIEFRDSSGTARTYEALPIITDGFDISADGSYSRPTLTIANISSVFSTSIGDLDYEKLVGRRITRRVTLRKYLVGESEDSGAGNPPVEYPKTTYIIDRIKDKNILQVTFELAAPFDLAGINLPRRTVVGGACPWKYKGANNTVTQVNKVGGCTWNPDKGSSYVFLNKKDEYVVPASPSITTYAGSATSGTYYKTAVTLTKVNADGTFSSVSAYDYWQSLSGVAATPSDSDITNWRRVRIYSTYSSSSTYNAYQNTDYNEYVLYSGDLWQVKTVTQSASAHDSTPQVGLYWTHGDQCGKKVASCSRRFHALPDGSSRVSVDSNKTLALPFGGFPASRRFR